MDGEKATAADTRSSGFVRVRGELVHVLVVWRRLSASWCVCFCIVLAVASLCHGLCLPVLVFSSHQVLRTSIFLGIIRIFLISSVRLFRGAFAFHSWHYLGLTHPARFEFFP